jgi:uncharacterized protein YukE
MPFEGMDADQLRGLAAQINSDAQTLSGLVTTMTGVLADLTLFWQGPMVAVFEQDWQAKHRPSLLAAFDTLTGLHTHLVSNVDQQASASAEDGGWTAQRILADAGDVVGFGEGVLTAAGLVSMTKLLDGTPVGSFLDDDLGPVGTAVGVYQTDHEMLDTYEELGQGHYVAAANDYVNAAGDGLETAGGIVFDEDPVAGAGLYAAGFAVKLLDEDVNLAASIDWEDVPSPFSGSNFQQYYVPAIESKQTWEQVGNMLWGAA